MKLAVCTRDVRQMEKMKKRCRRYETGSREMEVDYFQDEERLAAALRRKTYDIVMVCAELENSLKELVKIRSCCKNSIFTLVCAGGKEAEAGAWQEREKYIGEFNRKPVVVDIQDIYMLDSYKRVTYVCTAQERIRVNGRLDEEEKKLPPRQFIRISQGTIVNLRYIKKVEGCEIAMDNGASLFISVRRRKEFMVHYRAFLEEAYGMRAL